MVELNEILEPFNLHFGCRVANEVALHVRRCGGSPIPGHVEGMDNLSAEVDSSGRTLRVR
jgi:hypothetical protein